jgi:hypothetical protein
MTITKQYEEVAYISNGTVKTFGFDFAFIDNKDIKVYLEYEDHSEEYTLPFSVKGDYRNQGGQVIFNSPIATGQLFTIRRYKNILQNSQYKNSNLDTTQIEKDFDNEVLLLQQVNDNVKRTMRLKPTSLTKIDLTKNLNEDGLNYPNPNDLHGIALQKNQLTNKYEFIVTKEESAETQRLQNEINNEIENRENCTCQLIR